MGSPRVHGFATSACVRTDRRRARGILQDVNERLRRLRARGHLLGGARGALDEDLAAAAGVGLQYLSGTEE